MRPDSEKARVAEGVLAGTYRPLIGSHTELRGDRGAFATYQMNDHLALDAACPGCGERVAAFQHPQYHVNGPGEDRPTILEQINFTCCDWIGSLTCGIWSREP